MHELGHALGLDHVNEAGQTMVGMVTPFSMVPWSDRDIYTTDEVSAIQHFINLSQCFLFRDCGVLPMLPVTDPLDIYGIK